MLLDRAPSLGTGSSGKIEGWLHTGALYSGADDGQTFLNCVNSLEDLINHYAPHFSGRCNMGLRETRPGQFAPAVRPADGGWFHPEPVYSVLPTDDSPDIQQSRFRNDALYLEIQRQRVLSRLEAAYGSRHNWRQDGGCVAPRYDQIEMPADAEGASSVRDTSGILRDLCLRFDQSFGLPETRCDILRTPDVTMDSGAILRDLVASGLSGGVDFETGVTVQRLVTDRSMPPRLDSLRCRRQDGTALHVRARLFVFAMGAGFGEHLQGFGLQARLRETRSAMVVVSPALEGPSFARMSLRERFHFNHLVQRGRVGDRLMSYSMLANSGYAMADAADERGTVDIDTLLDSAERYFGSEALYGRRLFSYDCVKTEFISTEDEKRRYSYWIEVDPAGRWLAVLPGKFSFFPTLAHQACLRIKELLDFKDAEAHGAPVNDREHRRRATELVALPYPLQILADHGGGA
jgi:FAD dependent oxidoreductase